MTKIFRWYCWVIILSLGSCVNLKQVSKFSQTSIKAVEQFESLTTNFTEVCEQDERQERIRNFDIYTTGFDCKQNQKADSISQIIYTATKRYLYGLSNLSKNELTEYQTDDLTQTLATGNFGPVDLNAADVEAYSDISTLLLRSITDNYRRKKTKTYIIQGHKPFLKLVGFLQANLKGSLNGKLEVQKSSLQNFYFDFIKDKKLSDYERTRFAEDYYTKTLAIEKKQEELTTFANLLKEISIGHETLYNNIRKKNKKVKKELTSHPKSNAD